MAALKNYDSDFCGSLPLSHINVIQDYGYLVVVARETLSIIQVSENVAELLGVALDDIIDSPLGNYTDAAAIAKLQKGFADKIRNKIPFTLPFGGQNMSALAHFREDSLLLELEKPDANGERSFTNVFEDIKYAIAAIEQANSVEQLSQIAIAELRKLTGFDGIMMYRFDADWNGTVIAEEKVEGLENYLGHTFPASDIPKQARQLYLQNPYRLIPDRDFKPVRLYPVINPQTRSFTDMAGCNLRGVAAVHLEYLKNMNVQASMSIRVIYHEQLWGLIACHHLTPRYLSLELCSVCELLSSVISNKVTAILYKETFEEEAELQRMQTGLAAAVYADNDLVEGLLNPDKPNLMQLFGAGGVVAVLNGRQHTLGEAPDAAFIENMVLWLQNKHAGRVFVTDELPLIYDDALPYAAEASGALAIPVDAENGEYIICFRPELVKTINWGGDPDKAINFEPDGKNYHPRNSFKLWQQTVRNTARPWSEQHIRVAENMRSLVYEFTTRNL
ncbi:GAF domain-containing protein [Mucilaginibacter pedocola]|uniref:Phytochrome n=1 Tax=Mucilaginibacter pedocola TaxID=1792845 RepID=A0A1S9PFU0_9SPHI|nr:GAF domain-containing protein [Mucilaginibacter pedocola]OOQ59799.1 phytochrome [Mucilaginibacter pedocola]